METKFFSFVWRYSRRDQIVILLITVISFPLVYFSLEIPKIIINDAISGSDFPRVFFGFEFGQVPYLLMLCATFLLMVVLINAIKWVLNVQIGMTGERMLRRMRFMLLERIMRFRIAHFQSTKSGEVIQSVLGEIEPLGGFIGETIATPAFQGGLLVVYVTFIFVQDPILGFAAISLYPIQAFLIPRLQKRIIRLNKERARNTRALADTIGESVNVIADIHTNDTARWHLAQVSSRLHSNTLIRLDLFRRKFTIKFINNFMNQLTPFFFYSAGGYLVIEGDLDFGSLVAVLAAYKDLAGPWKQVLNYYQRWSDFNSRYEFVVENFSGEDLLGPERIAPYTGPPLTLPLVFSSVEGGAGSGGLTIPSLTVEAGQMVAVSGGAGGGREVLLRLAAGLDSPKSGRVSLGDQTIADATLPQVGAAVAFVGSDPGMISGSMRANLLYGLFRNAPDLADQETADIDSRLREARATGNTTADSTGDWVDYAAAGVETKAELDARLLMLVDRAGLSEDLYFGALDTRLSAEQAERWTAPIKEVRAALLSGELVLDDLVEPWDQDTWNGNASLLENLLFAMPISTRSEIADYVHEPSVIEMVDHVSAGRELSAIGWDIAREFADLLETVGPDSPVLDGFSGYDRAQIIAASDLIAATPGQDFEQVAKDGHRTLLGLAFAFVVVRDRLDVIGPEREARLLGYRSALREVIAARTDFVPFDDDQLSPALTIAENIVPGKRRIDRKSSWRILDDAMEAAIRRAGLRDELVSLGLAAGVGGLSATARRRVALVRALLKRPKLLILDGMVGSATDTDIAARAAIRADLPEGSAVLYAATQSGAEQDADVVVNIDDEGAVQISANSREPSS